MTGRRPPRRRLRGWAPAAAAALIVVAAGPSWAATQAPTNTTPPSVSGTATSGQTLTANSGAWSGAQPITYAYAWQRCTTLGTLCVAVAGATATTYVLTPVDVGFTIRVGVTATNGGGTSAATYSPVTTAVTPVAAPAGDPVIATAGDIACDPSDPNFNGGNGTSSTCTAKSTSNLLVNTGLSAVLPLGDEQYDCGALSEFQTSYGPSWGRANAIAHPVPGNHEYTSSNPDAYGDSDCSANAQGYYNYFGSVAGNPASGYYSYDIGAWHLIALNTNRGCRVVFCKAGSAQEVWLRSDLAAHAHQCVLAYWHAPVFSSTTSSTDASALFTDLYNARADIVLNGHAHNYERFAPLRPDGTFDPAAGVREFVVGTGGADHIRFKSGILSTDEAHNDTSFGVLRLTLHGSGYDWRFVSSNTTFSDSGSGTCHNAITQTGAPVVTTGSATGATGTTASVAGTVTPNGLATSWWFDYGPTTAYGSSTPATSLDPGTTSQPVSALLSGLSSSTTYHYRLVASNAAGTTNGADATLMTTSFTAPAAVTQPATGITGTTATLNGTVNPNGNDTTYVFRWGTDPTTYASSSTPASAGSGTTPVTEALSLTGLATNTVYYYEIDATAGSVTTAGAQGSFTTTACTPGTATATDVADSFTNSANPTLSPGSSQTLRANTTSTGVRNVFVMFDTSTVVPSSCQVQSASVQLVPTSSSTGQNLTAYATSSTWSEATLSWNTQPTAGAQVGSATSVSLTAGTPLVIPLAGTGWLDPSGLSSIELTSSTAASKDFESREYAGTLGFGPPVVTVTYG